LQIIGTQVGLDRREKVALLKERLAFVFRNPERDYRLNTRQTAGNTLQYTDEAVDAGELMCALGQCSRRQQEALRLWLGRRRMTQEQVAGVLRVSVITVKRDLGAAMRRMVEQVWEE